MSQLNLTLMLSSLTDWSPTNTGNEVSSHTSNSVIPENSYPQASQASGSIHQPAHHHHTPSYYTQLISLLQRYNQSRSGNASSTFGSNGGGLNLTQIELLNELISSHHGGNSSSSLAGSDAAQLSLHLLTNSLARAGVAAAGGGLGEGGGVEVFEDAESHSSSGDVLPTVRIVLCVIYAAICLLGVAGNGLVFFSVVRNPAMHSVTNVFISNLAFSDVLLSLFAVPITPLYLLVYRAWHFGAVLCHLLPFAQGASIYISAFTLMSIAIDRYQVIMYPLRARMKMNVCIGIILAIWLVTVVITSPYAYYMTLMELGGSGGEEEGGAETAEAEVDAEAQPVVLYCDEQWPADSVRLSYTVLTSILQFVVPLLIIGFCYTKVCGKLWDRTKSIPGSVSARREEQERERARRTNTMLICMVVCFVLSWAGLNIYNLLMDFVKLQHNTTAFLVLHVIAMSSVIYNPILYGVLNENFRKEFKAILPCLAALFTSSSSSSDLQPSNANHHQADASSRRRSSYNTTAGAVAATNNHNNNNNISSSTLSQNSNAHNHSSLHPNSSKRCVKLHLAAATAAAEDASISDGSGGCGGGKADTNSLISSEQMQERASTTVTTTALGGTASPATLRVNGDNRRAVEAGSNA